MSEKKIQTLLDKHQKDLVRRYEQAVGMLVRHMVIDAERRAEMMIAGEPTVALDIQVNKKPAKPVKKRKQDSERHERTHLAGAKGRTRCGHMKLSEARTANDQAFTSSADPCGTCARVAGIKLK
jgi:hypothetical protein